MKIFGNEKKKIESQIQSLQQKVLELEAQIKTANAEHKKSEASASKAQSESANALAQAYKAQTESAQALTDANAQLDAASKQHNEATQENELLLSQLMLVQEELEKIFLDKKQLEAELVQANQHLSNEQKAKQATEAALAEVKVNAPAELQVVTDKYQQLAHGAQALEVEVAKYKAELASASVELVQQQQNLAEAKQHLSNEQKAKQAAEAALAELKAKSPAQIQAVTEKYQQQAQAALALEAELSKHKSDLDQALQALSIAKAEAANIQQAKLELDTLQARTLFELEQLKNESAQLADQHTAKLKDSTQENDLLLTQLMQIQEELESYYIDKTKFEKLYQDVQARWARLEKRYPNYVDFGSVELVAFDNLSDVPSITWRVKDYAQGGLAFEELLFQTVLQDGQPGIGLVTEVNDTATENSALVPKLLIPQSKHLERFVRMGQTEFRQLMAATTIVTQLEASGWRGVGLPKDFDLGFWRESLKLLPTQLQALPVMLRYDAVKIKRELVNPDYEHLWLEFKGLGLGARTWAKFEIRLGAAMVQRGGFSQFPKFEIPLIDGKTKPFESWYAESQDDNGAKLELRFSLEKQVFDTSVWTKLEDVDKALLLRLIYAMPEVLLRLEAQHASIHRPWATWVGFAKASVQVIETSRAAAQPKEVPSPKELPTPKSKALPAPAKVAKLSAPASKTTTTKKTAAEKPSAKAKPPGNAKTTVKKAAPAAKRPVAAKKSAPARKPVPLKKATSAKKLVVAKKPVPKKKPVRK